MTRDMSDFHALAEKQLRVLFPWTDADGADAAAAYADADARFLANCSRIRNKYYADAALVSPLQSCQYAMFLYLANGGTVEALGKTYEYMKARFRKARFRK